jgi:hypothetical protein
MRTACLIAGLAALTASPVLAQFQVGALGEVASVEHKVDFGRGIERSTGQLVGGAGVLRLGPLIEISAGGETGSLEPDSSITAPADLARLYGVVSILPVPWLALRVGGSSHTFTTTFASQRWITARLGAEARLAFVGGGLTSVLRFDFFPVVDVTDLDKPDQAFGAAAGLRWNRGVVAAELLYALERYDFPAVGGVERHEQMAMLIGRLGLQFGRTRAAAAPPRTPAPAAAPTPR